jgi:hypothetical protein
MLFFSILELSQITTASKLLLKMLPRTSVTALITGPVASCTSHSG